MHLKTISIPSKNSHKSNQESSRTMTPFLLAKLTKSTLSLIIGLSVLNLASSFISNSHAAEIPAKTEPKTELKEASSPSIAKPIVKALELTPAVIYDYLLAEIAAQRGEFALSSHLFLELAKSTRYPSLAERAAKAAALGSQGKMALDASVLWAELDPSSLDAEQASSQLLIASGDLQAAKPHIQKLLAKEVSRAAGFLAINSLFARQTDKKLVLSVVTDLAKPYPNLAEAHFAIAHAALAANLPEIMQLELSNCEKLRPAWELPVLMKAQLMQQNAPNQAILTYRDFLKKYPKANEVRLALAKTLINQKRFDEAKPELVLLSKAANGNAEIFTVLGLLAIENKDYVAANQYIQQALNNNFKDPEQLYIYLGKLAEQQKNDPQALGWFKKVQLGAHVLEAKILEANIIARTQTTDAAIKMLDEVPDLGTEQQIIIIQTQAALLSQAKRLQESFDLLNKAVQNLPNTPDLIYDYASAAERLGKYDLMEIELNKAITMKPDYAAAYNALGYSLADRNIKLDLAKQMIDKALTLTPDDHFMIDSLGWVYYRLGKLDLAIEQLRRAYSIQADPEIAAHLGEVLWQQGKIEEAKKIWQDALKENADNEVLLTVIKKFNA